MRLVVVLSLCGVGWLTSIFAQANDAFGQYGYSQTARPYLLRPIRPFFRVLPGPLVADAFDVNPLDDGYDYPFGYGEYAVYGRWAYANAAATNCYLLRRKIRTGYGYRWRAITRCD